MRSLGCKLIITIYIEIIGVSLFVKKALYFLLLCSSVATFSNVTNAEEQSVSIVFAGDLSVIGSAAHGDYAELSRLLIDRRNDDPNTLFLFGGASLSPSYLSSFDRGAHIIDLLNSLMPNAMAVSKRDLSFSEDEFSLRTYEAAFPMVLSNGFDPLTQGNLDGVNNGLILSAGKVKVGVLAIVHESAIEHYLLQRLKITPPYEAVVKNAGILRQAGADVVVLIYSSDHYPFLNELLETSVIDLALTTDQEALAEERDLIHARDTIVRQKGTAAVITFDWSESDGVITDFQHEFVELNSLSPELMVQQQVDDYKSRLDRILAERLATVHGDFHTQRTILRTQENAFANIVADALRSISKTDIAVINSGAIRGNRSYSDGYVLTRRDIALEIPFRSRINVLKIRGSHLLAALENSVSQIEEAKGRFLQVSGMSYTFDSSLPAGTRIKDVIIGNAPLELDRAYSIASSDYLTNGGDGYDVFKFAMQTKFSQQVTPLLTDIVISYLRKNQNVDAKLEGRVADVATRVSGE